MKKSEKPKETLGSRLSESRSLSERYAEVLELREMNDAFSRVFTLEVDGRPTLAFEASRTREAQEICKGAWLRDDLIVLSSGGIPICGDRSNCQCGRRRMKRLSFMNKPPRWQSRPMTWCSPI